MSSANLMSIIISTYNRCDLLEQTIDSILKIIDKNPAYELLIIDNNSTDNTSIVVNKFLPHPVVKYFMEPNQGLSHARNRGMKEAAGDVFVFLDDDIELEENYFQICRKLIESPEFNIVGGKVLPFGVAVPEWLPEKFYYLVSIFDLGNKPKVVSKVMGANYLISKRAALEIGDYNVALGRKGNVLSGGEEIEYMTRAREKGYKIFYDPSLIVYHKINNKLNKAYVFDYSKQLGKSECIMDHLEGRKKVFIKFFKAIAAISLYYTYGFYAVGVKQRAFFNINKHYAIGYLSGILKS